MESIWKCKLVQLAKAFWKKAIFKSDTRIQS